MDYDVLIRDCTVLNPDLSLREGSWVGVAGGRIAAIGPSGGGGGEPSRAAQTIDGSGKLLMPGLIDGHTHCCQQLLRGRIADEYPMIWTRFLVPFESSLDEEDCYFSALLACVEMIKCGTTSFADSGGVHMHRVADAVVESGMRAAIARSTMDSGEVVRGPMKESTDEAIARTEELYRAYQGAGDGRLEVWFAIRQVMTCSPELARRVGEKAAEYGTGIHAHLCEHRDEVAYCLRNYRKRPAQFLDDAGVLGPRLLAAHDVALSEPDISLMARRGVKVVHCPRANLSNHGFPKTPRIAEAGLSVGLGCDGAATGNLDLFDEMKALRYAVLAYWGLPVFDPTALSCAELLRMATAGGAAALGHADSLGAVEVGRKADLILLDIEQPHLYPTHNLVNTIADSACGHDVTDSIIDGKIVMRDRRVLTVDEERVRAECAARMGAVAARAGFA